MGSPGTPDPEAELKEATARYRNARRRARYSSGNPSFSPNISSRTDNGLHEQYELAMCDCDVWERTLRELTGGSHPHYDPRADFHARWHTMMKNGPMARHRWNGHPVACHGTDRRPARPPQGRLKSDSTDPGPPATPLHPWMTGKTTPATT